MARKLRPVALEAFERGFRLDRWVERHLTVVVRSGPEWLCVCPICYREKLAIHIGRKAWHCLSAECRFAGWSPSRLVSAVMRVSLGRAKEIVAAETLGVDLGPVEALEGVVVVRDRQKLPQASLPPVAWALAPTQWAYAIGRGISPDHIDLFKMGTILSDGTGSKADWALSGRIIFPIWDLRGELVSWVARAVDDHPAKTINMPRPCRDEKHGEWCTCYHDKWGLPSVAGAAEAGEVVLGLHLVAPGQPVIVVEGPIDAAVCGPSFAAILGSSITHAQAELIAKSGASEAIVLLDGDEGGIEGSPKVGRILEQALPTRIGICPAGTDPGALGRERAWQTAMTAPRSGTPGSLGSPRPSTIKKPRSLVPFQGSLETPPRDR